VEADGASPRFTVSSVTSVFAVAGLLGVVLAILPYRIGSADAVPSAIANHAFGRTEAFRADVEAGALGVVLLGDSRLLYATPSDATLTSRLSAVAGKPVAVLRLAGPGATFADYAPVAAAIVDADPALVILQSDLFDRVDEVSPNVSVRNTILWNAAGSDLWNPTGNLLPLDQDWSVCPSSPLQGLEDDQAVAAILESQHASGLRYRSHGAHVDAVVAFVAELHAVGIGVGALEIPESSTANAAIERGQFAGLTSESTIEVIAPEVQIPDDAYCDPAHLDPAGRDLFTDALIVDLDRHLGALMTTDLENP